LPSKAIAQFAHIAWTAKDGAPNAVHALAQTTDGYLWMGGPTGLYRFDGIRFEQCQPQSGQELRSEDIRTLMATPDGGLWIGYTAAVQTFSRAAASPVMARQKT
jgi:ligand-binding sensor domain-containing protein